MSFSIVVAGTPSFECGPCLCPPTSSNLDVAISGILSCDACYTVNAGGGNQDVKFDTFTGINGTFTAVWNAINSRWEVVIGTITVHFYSSADGSCTDEFNSAVEDVTLAIKCESGVLTATAASSSGPLPFVVFNNSTGGSLSDPLDNSFVSGDCGQPSPPAIVAAYGGTITITV